MERQENEQKGEILAKTHQGLTFDKNHRIDSHSDSCNIRIWESISLIELNSKCSSSSEILILLNWDKSKALSRAKLV